MKTFIEELKVGDEVYLDSMFRKQIAKVSKVTKTQVHVGNSKFRMDGYPVGGYYHGCTELKELTDDVRSRHNMMKKREYIEKNIKVFSDLQVTKMYEALKDV